jgi:hypothetical protein
MIFNTKLISESYPSPFLIWGDSPVLLIIAPKSNYS